MYVLNVLRVKRECLIRVDFLHVGLNRDLTVIIFFIDNKLGLEFSTSPITQ